MIVFSRGLLIEPVWNRNTFDFTDTVLEVRLLIEPVWNRNLCIQVIAKSHPIF